MRLLAVTLLLSAASMPLAAQDVGSLPAYNSEHWTQSVTDDGTVGLFHNQSGAVCLASFRELQLSDVTSYRDDENNVSCSYTSGSGESETKLTTYFFRMPGLTGPAAYQQAVRDIDQLASVTGLSATRNTDHSERCRQAVTPVVAEQVLLRRQQQENAPEESTFGMGVSVYDFVQQSGVEQTSVLMAYELSGWIVKVRMTTPASEGDESYAYACNYSGLASAGAARALNME